MKNQTLKPTIKAIIAASFLFFFQAVSIRMLTFSIQCRQSMNNRAIVLIRQYG